MVQIGGARDINLGLKVEHFQTLILGKNEINSNNRKIKQKYMTMKSNNKLLIDSFYRLFEVDLYASIMVKALAKPYFQINKRLVILVILCN